ncbi:MAG: hypothetical protein QF464_04585 [Myxococcota bacterium]|nr:hypothetical protein [Myxococcota bacterium]
MEASQAGGGRSVDRPHVTDVGLPGSSRSLPTAVATGEVEACVGDACDPRDFD